MVMGREIKKKLLALAVVLLTGALGVFCAWAVGNDFERGSDAADLIFMGLIGLVVGFCAAAGLGLMDRTK
jgi:uncharacterized membrane protein